MSEGFDLGAFLAEQRSQGHQDSEGAFTVSTERALEKLAAFGLPGLYDWALKIVQAVNAWKAPELIIRQTRVATSFFFCPPQGSEFPEDHKVVAALRSGALSPSAPLHQLCMALRSLVEQTRLSFVLAIRNEGELGQPIFAGDDTSQLPDRTRELWTSLERDGLRLTVSHFRANESLTGRYIPTFSNTERRDVEIAKILEQRAFASAVPIIIDGRRLTNLASHSKWGHTRWQRPLQAAYLNRAETGFKSLGFARHLTCTDTRVPEPYLEEPSPWYFLSTLEGNSLRGELAELRVLLGLYEEPPHAPHHCVYWTRFGVVVRSRTMFNQCSHTTLSLFLPVDDYRTDLTGLDVELDNEDQERLRHLCDLLVKNINRLKQEVPRLSQDWSSGGSTSEAKQEEGSTTLSAGYSIYTESLSGWLPSIRLSVERAIESLEARRESPEERLRIPGRWEKRVCNDLETLIVELPVRVRSLAPK